MSRATEQIFLSQPGERQSFSATQVNLENVQDFSNLCRTCATNTQFVVPIFSGEGLQNNLADKINKNLPIKVCESDRLPRGVCVQCAHALLAWAELVECCRHADKALRTRLAQLQLVAQQESKPTTKREPNQIEQLNEFQEVAFVVPAHAPPQYGAPRRASPVLRKACPYCRIEYPQNDYANHVIRAHANRIFHCDECDLYVDTRHFISHMSVHAIEYGSFDDDTEEVIRPKIIKKENKKSEIKRENTRINTETSINETVQRNNNVGEQTEKKFTPKSTDQSFGKVEEENDFSDHSDTDDFGPLPESVFEAIEDSQDSHIESIETSNSDVIESDARAPVTNIAISAKSKGRKRKTPRTCPICAKKYTVSSSYFYHMKHFHKRTKEHECQICNRKFGTKGGLTQHASVHTGECPFECKECGKKFRTNASLYIHKQTHIGQKNYACTHCDASFRWKTHLGRHLTRHSKEKKHVCTNCGRGFSVKCDLLRHAKTHEAGNINCEKCGTKFAQLRYLKVHMEKKHPNVAD